MEINQFELGSHYEMDRICDYPEIEEIVHVLHALWNKKGKVDYDLAENGIPIIITINQTLVANFYIWFSRFEMTIVLAWSEDSQTRTFNLGGNQPDWYSLVEHIIEADALVDFNILFTE